MFEINHEMIMKVCGASSRRSTAEVAADLVDLEAAEEACWAAFLLTPPSSAPAILRSRQRAPIDEPSTSMTSPPRLLLGNVGDLLPTSQIDPLTDLVLPTIDHSGLSADYLVRLDSGKPQKKSAVEKYFLSKERQKRDITGWEMLQNGADAELAHDVLASIQSLMECDKITRFGGLAGCNVRPLPQMKIKPDGKNAKVMLDGKPVLAPLALHRYTQDKEISYSIVGLQHCSSPMKCPICSRKIRYYRRIQIAWGVWLLLEADKIYVMMTLTAPHSVNTDPANFVTAFCRARKTFMSSGRWKKIMKKFNYHGVISGNEITVDAPWSQRKSGMHYHSHCLLFFDRKEFNSEELKELVGELSEAWTESCEKEGLVTPSSRTAHLAHGLDLTTKEENANNDTASYTAADYIAKKVSFEVAPAPGSKTARRPDRLNQWQLMLLATTTHPELINDLDRVLVALNGRRLTYWTKHIQTKYGVPTIQQIKGILSGRNIEEILSKNITVAQQILGEIPPLAIPATTAIEEAEIELEAHKETKEAEENEEIIEGEQGEEVLTISFRDFAYITHFGAQNKFCKSLLTHDEDGKLLSLSEVSEHAKVAIQLISRGIDPITSKPMKPKRSILEILICRAKTNEERYKRAGYDNPVSWSLEPLLFDLSELNL